MVDLHVVALVLPSTCHYTVASFMAAVRSRPRPRRHSPPWFACCARRRLALSTWSTTKRNQEMTVRGEADSRDPPGSLHFASRCLVITSQKITQRADNTKDPAARPVVFQFERWSSTARCAGAVARLAHAYTFIQHMTSPVDIFYF